MFSPLTNLEIDIAAARERAVVHLRGDLDFATCADVRTAIESCGTQDVEVDVAAVVFFDCAGYTALTDAAAILASRGHRMRLVGARRPVCRVLDVLSGLTAGEPDDPAPTPGGPLEHGPGPGR